VLLFAHEFQIVEVGFCVRVLVPAVLVDQASFEVFVAQSDDYFTYYAMLFFISCDVLFAEGSVNLVLYFFLSLIFRLVGIVKVLVILHKFFSLQQFP
jgi:hypothetical protein